MDPPFFRDRALTNVRVRPPKVGDSSRSPDSFPFLNYLPKMRLHLLGHDRRAVFLPIWKERSVTLQKETIVNQ